MFKSTAPKVRTGPVLFETMEGRRLLSGGGHVAHLKHVAHVAHGAHVKHVTHVAHMHFVHHKVHMKVAKRHGEA